MSVTPHVTPVPSTGARLRGSMVARSPHEAHRAATPLELLFDLVFVVAVAQAANGLHHAVAEGHALAGLAGYAMVFFALWWAWMNFTWFASAYDNDDLPYRLAVFVQIAGALIFAAGVKDMFETRQPNLATLGGYVVMRLAIVGQWIRAASADSARRKTDLRYALGVALLQVAWVAMLLVPQWWIPGFLILATLELVIPIWAEEAEPTTWNAHHITERYGLFTLIVLGESVASATMAVQAAIESGEAVSALASIMVGGLLIVYALWWTYFDRPVHDLLTNFRKAIVWGYGHYLVFASVAAIGAGLAVSIDQVTRHAEISRAAAGAAVAIPVAVYLLCLWYLHDRPEYRRSRAFGPLTVIVILLTPITAHAVLLTGVILSTLVGVKLVMRSRGLLG